MELNKLKSGTLLVLLAKGFLGGAGLLVTMLLTRLLGTAEVGAYFMMAQIVNVGRLLSEAGMDVGLQKLIGVALADNDPAAVRRHTTSSFVLLMIGVAVVSTALFLGWQPLTDRLLDSPRLAAMAILAVPWLLGFSLEDLSSVFFRSLHEMKTAVLAIGLPRQLLLLPVLAWIWLTDIEVDLTMVIALVATSWLLSGTVSAALVLRRVLKIEKPAAYAMAPEVKAVLGLSLPMLLHTSALLVMGSADIWVLQIARGSEAVGVYGALVRISVSMAFLVGAVNMVLPPMLARLYKEGRKDEMEDLLRRSASWGAYLAVPLTIVFVGFGGLVLSLAFTPEYAVGAIALAILASAHCFNTLSGSPGYVLQMTGGHLVLMRLTLGVALLNLIGNIALVGPLGMTGVALSTGASLIVQNIAMVIIVKRRVGVKTWVKLPGLG